MFPLFATSVTDTSGKFAGRVANLPLVSFIQLANLQPMLLTPVANMPPVSLIPVVHLDLGISP